MEEALLSIVIIGLLAFLVLRGLNLAKIQTSAANLPEPAATNSTAVAEPAPINGSDIPEM